MASKVLLAAVFITDLVAFALAIAAEQKRSTASIGADGNCVYKKNRSTGLGVASFLLLFSSQAMIMFVSRCLCCGKVLGPSRNRVWAICLFVSSWITFIIAVACLLGGSAKNAYRTKGNNSPSCETVRKGLFGAGAAFIVFTGIATELFYLFYSKAKDSPSPYARDSGVRMGPL